MRQVEAWAATASFSEKWEAQRLALAHGVWPDLSKIHGDDNGKGYFTATLYRSGLRLDVKRGNEHNLKRRALRNLSSDAQMVHITSSFDVKDEHISATLGAPGGIRLAFLTFGLHSLRSIDEPTRLKCVFYARTGISGVEAAHEARSAHLDLQLQEGGRLRLGRYVVHSVELSTL